MHNGREAQLFPVTANFFVPDVVSIPAILRGLAAAYIFRLPRRPLRWG